jgi:hypothetical protein
MLPSTMLLLAETCALAPMAVALLNLLPIITSPREEVADGLDVNHSARRVRDGRQNVNAAAAPGIYRDFKNSTMAS